MIKDQNGNASLSTIYISPTNTDTIERYSTSASTIVSMVITSNYGSMTFGSDGISNWMILQNYTGRLISSSFKTVILATNLTLSVSSSTGVATMSWSAVPYNTSYTWVLYVSATNSYTGGQIVSTGSISGIAQTLSTTTTTTAAGYYYFTVVLTSIYSPVQNTVVSPIVQSTYFTSSQGPVTTLYIAVANNIATMTWAAYSGATGYVWALFQSASTNFAGAIIASGTTGSTYLISSYSGLTVGAYYYFVVYATTASLPSSYATSATIQYNNTPPTGGAITLNSIANSTNVTVTISSLAVNATDYAIYISPTTSTANAVYTIHTTTTLSYTGSPQTYTVPPSVTSLVLYAWGAGGGGAGTAGGAGAFLTGNLVVTPNRQYYAFVGGGGGVSPGAVAGYSGGGAGQSAGGGGGYSGLFTGLTPYQTNAVVVVGGGGGSGFNAYNALYPPGAYGGSATFSGTAQAGGYEQTGVGGGGGTQSAGGAAGGAGATAGSALQGGNAVATFYSGGGGGGYWGGGGGYYAGAYAEGGGGGGSSYAGSVTSVTGANTLNAAATSIIAPGSTNLYYVSGVAGSAASSTGGNGLIAVSTRYTSGQAISLTLSTRLSAATNYYAILVPKNGAGSGTAVVSAAVTSSSLPTGGAITLNPITSTGGTVTITTTSTGATGYYLYISTTTSTSGAIYTGGTITTLSYTGAIQSYTVPTGITTLTVYLWGAGGGGSQAGQNAAGGAGSFITGTMTVTAGTTYYVVVGGGGTFTRATGTFLTNPGGYGGGGQGYYAAGGGGYSGIFTSNTPSQGAAIVIAGGGGGAGPDPTSDYGGSAIYIQDSAQAGGTNGANLLLGGGGATASAGGIAGTFSGASGAQAGVAGSALTGGNGGQNYGGGGGGGYWGGGGGAYQAGASGGGGGNSFINLSYMSAVTGENSVAIASTATTAPAATNQFYVSGVAASAGGASGGNGLVVISAAPYTTSQVVSFSTTLLANTTYYAIMVPVNSYGNGTAVVSSGVSGSPPTGGSITLDAGLSLTGGSVTIGAATNATNYTVYISTTTSYLQSVYNFSTTTTGSSVPFSTTLSPGTTYYAVLLPSNNTFGNGSYSFSSGVSTPSTPVGGGITLNAFTTTTGGSVTITALASNATGYIFYISTTTSIANAIYNSAGVVTYTYNYTGLDQSVVIPSGNTSVGVTLKGAGGGSAGGLVSGTLTVTPSETLTIIVGRAGIAGDTANALGTNYGGGGGTGNGYGDSGGGMASIKRGTAMIVVAGGAGGSGYGGATGGVGGGLIGGTGGTFNSPAVGGTGGTQSAGGTGIYGGASGSLGIGGAGTSYGGGGGGGYYGGGGGGYRPSPYDADGGGGGGSSYVANLTGTVVNTQGGGSAAGANGQVLITFGSAPAPYTLNQTIAFTTTLSANTAYYAILVPSNSFGNGTAVVSSSQTTPSALYSFTTATFNTSGATGQNGPTLSQARTGMTGTPAPSTWNTNTAYFNMITAGYQRWTVPATRSYTFSCAGANGGSNGGTGITLNFTASLTQGHIITIVVGQSGLVNNSGCGASHGSGGGGTFIFNSTTSVLLAAAGGGAGTSALGFNASSTGTSGSSGRGTCAGIGAGGSGGGGGGGGSSGCCGNYGGGGGGGYTGNGGSSLATTLGGGGGLSYTNGATGGSSGTANTYNAYGGFGGGGQSGQYCGGGGGGYSGGGGGVFSSCACGQEGGGGGGGSYCYVATSSTGTNAGNGFVTIT